VEGEREEEAIPDRESPPFASGEATPPHRLVVRALLRGTLLALATAIGIAIPVSHFDGFVVLLVLLVGATVVLATAPLVIVEEWGRRRGVVRGCSTVLASLIAWLTAAACTVFGIANALYLSGFGQGSLEQRSALVFHDLSSPTRFLGFFFGCVALTSWVAPLTWVRIGRRSTALGAILGVAGGLLLAPIPASLAHLADVVSSRDISSLSVLACAAALVAAPLARLADRIELRIAGPPGGGGRELE
jgi:hypothetical protein